MTAATPAKPLLYLSEPALAEWLHRMRWPRGYWTDAQRLTAYTDSGDPVSLPYEEYVRNRLRAAPEGSL